jgi:hypothetical protein
MYGKQYTCIIIRAFHPGCGVFYVRLERGTWHSLIDKTAGQEGLITIIA